MFLKTCGSSYHNTSSWGDFWVTSCLQELWANSAMGRILLQLDGWLAVQGWRYCSSQAFIRSICLLVHG